MDHSLTILEQCLHVNAISGKTPPNESCFDWKLAENQLRLIESELIETRKACDQNDLSEFVDGICDVLMTTFGQAARNNFPIEEAFYLMSSSLLTRFDRNMDDAIQTMEKYRLLGITTKVDKRIVNDVEYYVVTVDGDQGPEYPDNKFLKSVNYQKPDYSTLVSLMTRDGELNYQAPSNLSELNSIEEAVDEVSFALNVAQQRLLVRNSKPNSGQVRILRQLLPSVVNWVCLGVAPGDRMKAKIAKETSSDAPLAAVVTLTIDSEQ